MKILFGVILLLLSSSLFGQNDTVVRFSIDPGFYSTAQSIFLKGPQTAKIYYTTDGSEPTSGSMRFSNAIKVEQTTVIRAKFYLNGKSSEITTGTFIIGRKTHLPVVSISTHPDYFFSAQSGIYVKGCCSDTVQPYKGANFWKGWEHPINIEYFDAEGKTAFNQPAGVRIFGGFSKGLPMKSLSIIGRKKYGKKYFKYPIFQEKGIKKYKSFILRNSGGDFNKTHFRDALITQLTRPIGLPIQAYQPVVLYINGEYWGIHNAREKINEYYLKGNFGADKDSVTIMKHRYDLQAGERKHYKKLLDFLRKNDLSDDAIVEQVRQQMNIENFIDYNITQVYADNRDAGGNIRYWRPIGDSGKWNWILFDTDMSMGISDWKGYKTNTLHQMTTKTGEAWPNPAWSTFIIRKLLENEKLRAYYAERFTLYLNTIFSEKTVLSKIDSIQDLLRPEMEFHQKKWGSKMDRWDRNVNILRDFAQNRPSYLRGFLAEKFDLGDTVHMSFREMVSPNYEVFLNGTKINEDFEGVFFTKQPITLEIKTKPGFEFVQWEGNSESTPKWEITPGEGAHHTPVVKKMEESPYWNQIVFNEIAYNKNISGDWIELYNTTENNIEMTDWKIYVPGQGIYPIDVPIQLNQDEFFVLAEDKTKLLEDYPENDPRRVVQVPKLKLSSKGFKVLLLDEEERIVDSLTLSSPSDHGGISLNDISKNNHAANSWSEEQPTPNTHNPAAKSRREEAESNKQLLFIGGLVLLVIGALLLVVYRKRKKSLA